MHDIDADRGTSGNDVVRLRRYRVTYMLVGDDCRHQSYVVATDPQIAADCIRNDRRLTLLLTEELS